MKARSAGLEIEIKISEAEREQLSRENLNGVLHFNDTMFLLGGGIKRDIPLSLIYNQKLGDFMRIYCKPKRIYFGNINSCRISFGDYHYERLIKFGRCGDRFLSGNGKVLIFVEYKK
ncbi:MAG: hypothetical protein Q8L29_00070 [archaeon]|nr:hypothetical protein [archaeon]